MSRLPFSTSVISYRTVEAEPSLPSPTYRLAQNPMRDGHSDGRPHSAPLGTVATPSVTEAWNHPAERGGSVFEDGKLRPHASSSLEEFRDSREESRKFAM